MSALDAASRLWDAERLVDCLVNVCLFQDERHPGEPIDLSDAELELAIDGLHQARQLESLVADEVCRLRRRIAVGSGRVEAYFEAHRTDFDTAHIARVAFASETEAHAAGELVRAGVLDFYALAEGRFLASARQSTAGASFEVVRRGGPSTPATEAILLARHNDVVGPIWDGRAYILALILLHTPARLDAPTVTAVEQALFDRWLQQRLGHPNPSADCHTHPTPPRPEAMEALA